MGLQRWRASMGALFVILMMIVGGVKCIQRRSASASPTPTPNPSIAALSGISALAGGAGPNGNGDGSGGTCTNQDLLTNLLVYQYLSGSLPNGGPPGNGPQLHALLGSSQGPATTTITSVTTSLTTLVVEVEPTTQFTTSTTSYVTTLTSVETKVIPVLFRGSKITTTIEESSEEVITATEYFTESSVYSPSIVQTLPVHITMTATSTRGVNGQFTLFELTPGPTSVIHQPISTATLDLDAAGLDVGNLDLSQIDLTSIAAGLGLSSADTDNSQMLSMLSSLLQNYEDPDAPASGAFKSISPGSSLSDRFRAQQDNFRSTRYESPFQGDYVDYDEPVEEVPKFNVLPGFTLSDRVASAGSTGRAATDTRYSKYHRKDRVDNNGIASADANARESERFSASTRRRTFSRTSEDQRRNKEPTTKRPPSSRFVPAAETQYFEETPQKFRPFGNRNDRQISQRRRPGLGEERSSSSPAPPRPAAPRPNSSRRDVVPAAISPDNVRTTVLTMYLSGAKPGEFHTSLRTVTLRSLSTRRRRDVHEDPASEISATKTVTPSVTENTIEPDISSGVSPDEIVHLLKSLDSTQVKQMLKSLQKWVDYYNKEVLDEDKNQVAPELTSSIGIENTEVETGATTVLPIHPSSISGGPASSNLCFPPPTVTETVYRTFIITSGISAATAAVSVSSSPVQFKQYPQRPVEVFMSE